MRRIIEDLVAPNERPTVVEDTLKVCTRLSRSVRYDEKKEMKPLMECLIDVNNRLPFESRRVVHFIDFLIWVRTDPMREGNTRMLEDIFKNIAHYSAYRPDIQDFIDDVCRCTTDEGREKVKQKWRRQMETAFGYTFDDMEDM